MIGKILTYHSKEKIAHPTHAVFLFTGRGWCAENMVKRFVHLMDIPELVIFSIEPEHEWYPMPNGANDQKDAVKGLNENWPEVEKQMLNLLEKNKITPEKTFIIGFSSGAVLGIEIATKSNFEYAAIFSHSGAVLEPENMILCNKKTKFFLVHSEDDNCFSWQERFVPMRDCLVENKYSIEVLQKKNGGHSICKNDSNHICNKIKIMTA
jgi:predicted esterase